MSLQLQEPGAGGINLEVIIMTMVFKAMGMDGVT